MSDTCALSAHADSETLVIIVELYFMIVRAHLKDSGVYQGKPAGVEGAVGSS